MIDDQSCRVITTGKYLTRTSLRSLCRQGGKAIPLVLLFFFSSLLIRITPVPRSRITRASGTENCDGIKRRIEAEVPHRSDVALQVAVRGRRFFDAYLMSKRSRFITLFQAAAKSRTNFSFESFCA